MLKVELNTVVQSVYGVDLQKYDEWDSIDLYVERVEVSPEDRDDFISLASKLNIDLDKVTEVLDSDVEELTARAMMDRYEISYQDEIYTKLKDEIIDVAIKDFNELNDSVIYDDIQFDLYNEDITVEEQEKMLEENFEVEFDYDNELFIFKGSMEKLALGVLSAIHGVGMFRFTSLQEFADQYEGEELDMDKLKETILSHLFWLGRYNEVYGTGTFSFDEQSYLEHIDR